MAKRNQVTTDLRISADAQLKSSRGFISKLDKIVDKFDFGDKINNQLINAKNQLKDYNKVLEKVHAKSLISDEELKDLVKAGKEIANIVTKTEKLYNSLEANGLEKFSKEYIKQMKAQEAAIAKIKNDYTNKTGKNFDKELANYDKLKTKIKELEREKDNLIKSGTNDIVTKEVDQLNKKLEEQKNKFKEIKKIQEESTAAYKTTVNAESQKKGYKNYDEVKSLKILSEDQIRRQLGTAEYKEQMNLISTINREIKEMEKTKQDANDLDEEAIALAKQYKIENVSSLETLKNQLKIKKDVLNSYKSNKSVLAAEKAVTAQMQKQKELAQDKADIENAGKKAELTIIQNGGYNSKASLSASASAVNKSINNISSQLTEEGIENIVNNASLMVAERIDKLTAAINKGNGDLTEIEETNKKLATQSERTVDEGDILKGTEAQIKATNDDGTATRNHLASTEERLSADLARREALELREALKEILQHANHLLVEPSIDKLPTSQLDTVDSQELTQALKLIDEAEISGFHLERYHEYLNGEMSSDQYAIIAGNTVQELKALEEALSKVNSIYSKVANRQKNRTEQNIDDLIKHNTNGTPLLDAQGNYIAKKGKEKLLAEKTREKNQINEVITGIESGEQSFQQIFNPAFQQALKAHQVLQQTAGKTEKAKKGMEGYSKAVNEGSDNLKRAADNSKFFGSTLDDFKNKAQYFLSMNYALDFITRTIRQASSFIQNLDKDMVQIGLVLEQTSNRVWKNFDTYSSMANRLSTTTSDVTAAMKLFYQQGLKTAEVNKMVEASAIAAALGESTMAEASETLTSIINSYNLSANEALSVTDKISQVAIVSAADFGELSTAIEKVASQAASVGLDLDHMMGYLGKMIETTREAPTNIGTALKTILANFSQFKEDPTAALEDGADINKAQKALKSVGIQLLDTNGEMRDLGDVIDELGQSWNELTRNQKSYLATTIAGTRQQSRFYSLMNDYERTVELVSEASNSAGKSTQQFVLYQDSLTGATARLKNQTEIFYGKLAEGDGLLKKLANTGTVLLKVINKIGPKTTLFAGLFGIKFIREGLNGLDLYRQKLQETVNLAMSTSGLLERTQGSTTVGQVIGQQNFSVPGSNWAGRIAAKSVANHNGLQEELDGMKKLLEVQNLLKNETVAYDDVLKQKITNLGISSLTTETLTTMTREETAAEIASAVATTGDAVAKKGATAATWGLIAANVALTAGVALIGVAIGWAVSALTKLANKENESTKSAQERLKKQQEEVKTLNSLANTYDKLNKAISLSEEEHAELANTIAELGAIYPELVAQYDAEGKAIALINEELAKKIQLEKQAEVEAAKGSLKATLGNKNKQLDAYGYHSGVESGQGAIWKFEELGIVLGENEQFNYNVKHNKTDDAIGDNAKEAFDNQQQQIENLVEKGKSFNLKGANTAQNSLDWMNIIDVLQNYAANNITTEHTLQLIDAFEKESKRLAKEDTDIKALESYYNELRTFVNESNVAIANANKQDISALASDYLNASVNASGLTDQKMGYAKTAINSILSDKKSELDDKSFKDYVYDDNQFQADVENVIKEIRVMTSSQLQYYEGFMKEYSTGNQSYSELKASYESIKDRLPITLQKVIESNLNSYDDYLDNFSKNITSDENVLNQFKTLKKSVGQKILEGYDSVIEGTLKDNEEAQEDFKNKYLELLQNENFRKDFNNLDTSNLAEIQLFKEKYDTALGEYGLEFFNSILTMPDYDVEKTSEGLNSALQTMRGTGATLSGASMEDVSTGNSQEGAFNILSSDDETRAQNLLLVGNRLIVSAEEIGDSYKKAYEDISNYTTQIISQAETKIEDNINTIRNTLDNENWNIGDKIDFSSLNETEKETIKNAQKAINNLEKQKDVAEELRKKYEALDPAQQANIDYAPFKNGAMAVNDIVKELSNLAEIYDIVTKKEYTQLDLINWIANDTSGQLLAALEVENGQLALNANSMEVLAEAKKQEALDTINAQIAKAEGQLYYLENVDECTESELANIKSIDEAQAALGQNFSNEIATSSNNLITWVNNWKIAGINIGKTITGLITKFKNLFKAEATGEGDANAGGQTGDASGIKNNTDINNDKIDIEDRKATLKNNIEKLKALRDNFSKMSGKDLLSGINKMGSYGDDGGNEFDPVLEKLEKFYNYLRQLEEIEARLNRLREKRNLIDATKNYYIDDLAEENKLLREQQSIYNSYIRDQAAYLNELKAQIQEQFGNWAYFNEDGVIQVKQTEFTANSEAEEERLNNFLELVDLYQNEYNTREENINKLYEIENTQLENISSMYEKILTRVEDVTEALNKQIDLLDHDMNMSFSNIGKFDIMDEQTLKAVEGIKTSQGYIKDFKEEIASLNKEVKNGPFNELLVWDETLEHWRVNEEALQDESIVAKYEKMGYAWQDIDTYVRSVAKESQVLDETMKSTLDSANEFAELLKTLIEDRIDVIKDFYSASTDEFNKIFDTFEDKMTDIDNQNNLFGVISESLEDKYLTLVTATVVLKQTIQDLKANKDGILEQIQKEYPEYIKMINGVAVVNKQAIEESTGLTEDQRAHLLQLYGILEASEEQIDEMEDKLVDYFNTMLEMEEAKRDAIIDLKQQVHDELIARDQQEIDDLQEKYAKMSELDNEYYSELQRRVSDAREAREQRQESSNIAQMQAQLSLMRADNSGAYNAEMIELQKQLNTALQTQADNDVTRELERIQREQQEREQDRQMTIQAMENVLTFKDENSWYWQEAQRIWDEGPESVTGFLRAANEYSNISDEQRAVEFENLTNNMNTAFTTLQNEAGLSDRISDGVVSNASAEMQAKLEVINNNLNFIEGQLEGKIDWANSQNMAKLQDVINDTTAAMGENTASIKANMNTLYTQEIGPGFEGINQSIEDYLGANSQIWKKLDVSEGKIGTVDGTVRTGFEATVKEVSSARDGIVSTLNTAKAEYLEKTTKLYAWIDKKYAEEVAPTINSGASKVETTLPTTSGNGNSSSSAGGNGPGSTAASKPDLAIGSVVSVKPGTRWYYDSYGKDPSGVATGGAIKYINLKGSHPYNIKGLGWIKKSDIVGYSKGGYVDYTGIANVHGTQREPEAFLNAKQTRLFEMLRDGLTRTASNKTYDTASNEVTREEYNIDSINIEVKELADMDSVEKITRKVKEEIYKDSTGRNNMAVRRR